MFHSFHRHTQFHVIQVNTVWLIARSVLTVQQAWSAHQLQWHRQGSASQVSSQLFVICCLKYESLFQDLVLIWVLLLSIFLDIQQLKVFVLFPGEMLMNPLFLPFSSGTYSDGNKQSCIVCPEGKYCPFTNTSTVLDCDDGTYSWGAQERCTPCPSGWMCPNKDGTGNVKCLPVCLLFVIMERE